MAVVVPGLGLAVTAAPGAASTALQAWAQDQPGAAPVVVPPGADVDTKHGTVTQLRRAGLDVPEGLRILTSTRNPFDYWHAEWHRSRTRWAVDAQDPTSWVNDDPAVRDRVHRACVQPFSRWLVEELTARWDADDRAHLNAGHIAEADHVVRMEHLDDDLRTAVGDPSLPDVPRHNVTAGRSGGLTAYRDAYDATAIQMVTRLHAPDLDRFGYRF